ncbi:MAG: hypothetical protein MUC87_12605 [Bacteroidia bacterium]|jgi:hypothetical protein|nr:hypothetical protein [Bacteroidia bacterium]
MEALIVAAIVVTVIFISLLVFYGTGAMLLAWRKTAITGTFALPAITGMLVWIAGFAILQTGGKTVMWLLVPLFMMTVGVQFSNFAQRLRTAFGGLRIHWLPVLLPTVLFAAKALWLFDYEMLIPDNAFYARIVESLSQSGQENEYHFLSQLDEVYKGVSPYHYGELWLASAYHYAGGMRALLLIATPIISVLFVQSLYELMQNGSESRMQKWGKYGLALLVLGCSWALIWPVSKVPQLAQYSYVFHSVLCFNTAKFAFPALLAAAAFLSYRQSGNLRQAGWWLCSIAVVSYTTLPAVCGAWVLCVVWQHFSLRRFKLITLHLFADLLPLLVPAGIVLFYAVMPGTAVSREGVSVGSFEAGSGVGFMLKIFAAGMVAAVVYLLPLTASIAYAVWPQRRQLPAFAVLAVVFATGALGAGAAAWGLLNASLNSVQLMSVCSGFLAVAAAVWVGVAFQKPQTKPVFMAQLVALGIMLGYFATSVFTVAEHRSKTLAGKYDAEFVELARHSLEYQRAVGFIWSINQYKDPFHCYPHFSTPVPPNLSLFSNPVPVGLGEMNRTPAPTPQLETQCKAGIKMGVLFNFCKRLNPELKPGDKPDADALRRFCKAFDIHFVFAVADAEIAPELGSYVVVATDKNTGLRLLRLGY